MVLLYFKELFLLIYHLKIVFLLTNLFQLKLILKDNFYQIKVNIYLIHIKIKILIYFISNQIFQ